MKVLPVGRQAVLLEVDDSALVPAAYAQVLALVASGALHRPREVVPAAKTVLVDGVDLGVAVAVLSGLDPVSGSGEPLAEPAVRHTILVSYEGPDLGVVAEQWGCRESEVVERHQVTEFVVAFCGFAPGFPYLLGRPELPVVRRRQEPRTRVPAGAVGLAAEYCGIYPREMPGGWLLVGRTEARLFDALRDRPALLQPGDRVRFEATS